MSTTSPPSVRVGAQRPRLLSAPVAATSAGAEAVELAATAGLHLDPWQQLVLHEALGERGNRWAAFEVALIVPRQNGKGSILEALELAALFLPDPDAPPPLILHSAHEFRTSAEHFRRMRTLIDNAPQLASRVRKTWTAAGSESIELHTGARLRFMTRTGGSGRGFSADLIVIDEAYNLTADAMAAVLPTMSARPNPQVWYTSSAGMPSSTQLARVRQRGMAGNDPSLAFLEWSAPDDADLDDPDVWALANPALGIRIQEHFVQAERAALPPEQFARERLGMWADTSRATAIDPAAWASLAAPDPGGNPTVFALDVAPDHSSATIAAAWRTASGSWLQLADTRPGVEWVAARAADLQRTYGGRLIVEQTGTAAFLLPHLERTEAVSRRFFADACSTLDAAVTGRTVAHGNNAALAAAVGAARWSSSGEAGQRVLSRKDPRVSPLVAAALALHGLSTTSSGGGWVISL